MDLETRLKTLCACILAALLASPLPAAEQGYRKCPESTQTCLNHMLAKLRGRGWLGIEMDDGKGPSEMRITRVVPASPAEAAGFKVDDVLVSVNGARFADNTEARNVTYEATKEIWKPGAKIRYVVLRKIRKKAVKVRLTPTLASLPSDVMAQMVGMHMLEHVQTEASPGKP